MSDIRPCILGCSNAEGIPFRAAPGQLACHDCAEKLAKVLADIGDTYVQLTQIDELIPGGTGDGVGARSVPGSRSPAVDAHLALSDVRTIGAEIPGVLGAVAEWARLVRAALSLDTDPAKMLATVPAGRLTVERELATLRFHWHWVLQQPWLPEFAENMRKLLKAMQHVGRLTPPTLRLGNCPTPQLGISAADGTTITLTCGAQLKVKVGDTEIRCTNCRTVWPKAKWIQLGDGRADYATLAEELGVPVTTLRKWCSVDGWETTGTARRRLVARADALASYYARNRAGNLGPIA